METGMKKVLKWIAIVLGILVLGVIIAIASVFIAHDRYGFYPGLKKRADNRTNVAAHCQTGAAPFVG